MSDANEDLKFTLKVMIDKKKNKVLFAESDCQFVDILLSFLSLPMGRILKALNDHYGEKAPTIGSLSNLYRSLAGFDNAVFVTDDAKKILLNPRSPFEVEYEMLKLSVTDSQPTKYLCRYCGRSLHAIFPSVIDILQRNVTGLAEKYFKSPSMKNGLMKPSLVHGSVTENYILPLDQRCMTRDELQKFKFASLKFPKGQGRYLARPIAYMVMDDPTMMPLRIHSTISFLHEKNIPMSDVEEIAVQVGLKEALCILKASLTSTSVLTDALLNSVPIKQPNTEKCEIKTGFKENSNKRVKKEV